ncbi:hypothetical protein DH2020_003263 [Rehmannia glutinosa]|uniref:Uncharacterized protein n=1 Tax=Rehmannia glutinosa TaxID=99300 RepID=A0ABR0XL41_REHGL
MLLRSSSTPVLGSLLQSFSESPNHNHHHHHQSDLPSSIHHNCTKLSFSNGGSQNVAKSLVQSPSVAEIKGFRRVQSDGNLEELANASYNNVDELSFSKKFARKPNFCTLEAIPSFSHHNLGTSFEDDDSDDEDELQVEENANPLRIQNLVSEGVSTRKVDVFGSMRFDGVGKMYLASGPGVSGIGVVDGGGYGGAGGGGSNYRPVGFNRDGGDSRRLSMEEYYKSMLEENPGNPLFLRNYAHFLYQKKGDLEGAEEYYSRAILADPLDGEILCQYGKLIWELHHDKDRAVAYFERAVQASSQDSHIHAAYASFLWDMEDDEVEKEENEANSHLGPPHFHHGLMASVNA